MKNDLVNRYIYAVTKRLPNNMKDDVASELSGLIEDMLTERCGEVVPTEKDICIVLNEIGSPNELYEKYDVDGKKCLIGSPYYSTYKLVLKIVLVCVAFGMTLSALIIQITTPNAIWYENVLSWFSMLWFGLISAFAFVTLIFAVFYHKGINIGNEFDLNNLPAVPNKKQVLSKKESIFEIAILILFFVIFITAPQIFGAIVDSPTRIIPIFNVDVIKGTWYIILLFTAMGVIREIIKLLEGRYNKRVMIATIITNIFSAISAFWWMSNDKIMNQEFILSVSALFAKEGNFISNIFANFQYFFLGVILFALVLDTINCIVKSK
ncbi:MAG TPA: hypothetical protein GX401_01635 [Clostridiales bacterium]|nr:hypothetical protein [Clostridiales bacterium]